MSFPLNNDAGLRQGGRRRTCKFAYEYFLNPFMGVGGQLDFGYHYFLDGQPVNGMDALLRLPPLGLGELTFHLGY